MGMPAPGWDPWAQQSSAAARRRRRRRRQRQMLWLLTGVTTVVLLVIALMIMDLAKKPTVARPAALSASARTVGGAAASGSTRRRVSPRGKTSPSPGSQVALPKVTDNAPGLSYQRLSSPWRRGCPSTLNTPVFSWSAGENAVAGQVSIGGSIIDWHGIACSSQLQQQFAYSGPADLEPTAMSLVDALDPAYYSGVQHYRTLEGSSAMQVSGHQAWVVKFGMDYPDGASQGFTWSSELGAVVVVGRGAGQAPAVFYVSVPGNLDTSDVGTLISSLRLDR